MDPVIQYRVISDSVDEQQHRSLTGGGAYHNEVIMSVREEATTVQLRWCFNMPHGRALWMSVQGRKITYWIVDSLGCRPLQAGDRIL